VVESRTDILVVDGAQERNKEGTAAVVVVVVAAVAADGVGALLDSTTLSVTGTALVVVALGGQERNKDGTAVVVLDDAVDALAVDVLVFTGTVVVQWANMLGTLTGVVAVSLAVDADILFFITTGVVVEWANMLGTPAKGSVDVTDGFHTF